MIGEWEFATLDALKCKEMNSMSIKCLLDWPAYQGVGDHKVCMEECLKGLEIRESDIALKEIWKKSDRILHLKSTHRIAKVMLMSAATIIATSMVIVIPQPCKPTPMEAPAQSQEWAAMRATLTRMPSKAMATLKGHGRRRRGGRAAST